MEPALQPSPSPEDLALRYRQHGDAEAIGGLFDATAPHLLRVALAIAPESVTATVPGAGGIRRRIVVGPRSVPTVPR